MTKLAVRGVVDGVLRFACNLLPFAAMSCLALMVYATYKWLTDQLDSDDFSAALIILAIFAVAVLVVWYLFLPDGTLPAQ